MLPGDLGIAPLAPFFLDLLHAPAVALLLAFPLRRLLAQLLALRLERLGAPLPHVCFLPESGLLPLQVGEGLFEGRCELFFGLEVLFDEADAGFLIFLDLGGESSG